MTHREALLEHLWEKTKAYDLAWHRSSEAAGAPPDVVAERRADLMEAHARLNSAKRLLREDES